MGNVKIIKASAGTGKTYTLTREIVSYYLQHDNAHLEHFLLITFTRNAAAELLHRFYEQDLLPILTLPNPQKSENQKHIIEKYNSFIQKFHQGNEKEWKEWQKNAKHRFFHDLLKQNKVLIGTVDSILSQLSRHLFILAGVSPNWESVLQFSFEELSSYILQEDQSPPDWLQKWLEKEKDPLSTVKKIIEDLSENEKKRLCLLEWDLTLQNESAQRKKDSSIYLHEWINEFYKNILLQWQLTLEPELHYLKDKIEIVETPKRSKKLYLKWKNINQINHRILFCLPSYTHNPEGIEINLKEKTLDKNNIFKQIIADIQRKIENFEKEIYLFLLSLYFYDKLRQYELKENRLSLASQKEYLARFNHLLTPEPLYHNLGTKISFVGWDEFQDTSYLQYYLFYPLLQEIYSSNNETQPNQILFVGDLKQAIYAWRNSEPEIMADFLKDHFPNPQKNPTNPSEQFLNDNYRSSEELLLFFSLFMKTFLDNLQKNFQNHSHLQKVIEKIKNYGYDTLLTHQGKPINPNKLNNSFHHITIVENKEKGNTENFYQNLIDAIQTEYHNGVPYGEMLILVRNNNQINEIEEQLKKAHIPVMPAGKRQIGSFLEVQWLYYLAYALLATTKQEQHYAKLHLKAILFDKLNQHLSSPTTPPDGISFLSDQTINQFLDNLFNLIQTSSLSHYLPHLPVIDFFERLIEWTKQIDQNQWFCFENEGIQSFFTKLLAESEYRFTFVTQFLTQFPLLAQQEVEVDTAKNAVQIMTIHKAKGLESHVVFLIEPEIIFNPGSSTLSTRLPFHLIYWLITGKKNQPPQNTKSNLYTNFLWEFKFYYSQIDKILNLPDSDLCPQERKYLQELKGWLQKAIDSDFTERMNLLYVALTRAKEKIYFFLNSTLPSKNPTAKSRKKNPSIPTLMKYAFLDTLTQIKNKISLGSPSSPQNHNPPASYEHPQTLNPQYPQLEWQSFSWRHKITFIPPQPLLSRYDPEALHIGIMIHRYLAQPHKYTSITNPTIRKAVENARQLLKELNLYHYLSKPSPKNQNIELLSEFSFITQKQHVTSRRKETQILRPDLVIINHNSKQGWLIDFKYSSFPPENPEQQEKYENQVKNYYQVLKEYYPHIQQWKGYLFYLKGEKGLSYLVIQ